jgi:hypothetical protein
MTACSIVAVHLQLVDALPLIHPTFQISKKSSRVDKRQRIHHRAAIFFCLQPVFQRIF